MTARPPAIISLDEEDACIHEHEIALEGAKCAKEERQRQREEAEEAERVCREVGAKKAQRDTEAKEA